MLRCAAFVAGVIWLVSFPAIGAQQSPLERFVERTPSGGPFFWAPPQTFSIGHFVAAVGRYAGVPVGFEGALADSADHAPADLQAVRSLEVTSLAGLTVREALDLIVAADPRYRWVEMDGVPVVRPVDAWADPANLLNQTAGDFEWDAVDVDEAFRRFRNRLFGREWGHDFPVHGPVFAGRVRNASFLTLLNEIVRSHGSLIWRVYYRCGPSAPAPLPRPLFLALDEIPVGGSRTCAANRPVVRRSSRP